MGCPLAQIEIPGRRRGGLAILLYEPFQMQQHGGLAKLGSSVEQDRLAPQAAAQQILREPSAAGELSRVEGGHTVTSAHRPPPAGQTAAS